MRFALFGLVLPLLVGCSLPPTARREIALLKNEIIDLQNQYFALKAEYFRATGSEPVLEHWLPPSGAGDWQDTIEPYEIILGERRLPSTPESSGLASSQRGGPAVVQPASHARSNDLVQTDSGFRLPRIPATHAPTEPSRQPDHAVATMTRAPVESVDLVTWSDRERRQRHDSPTFTVQAEGYGDDGPSPDALPSELRVVVRGIDGGDWSSGPGSIMQFSLLDASRPSGSQRIGYWELNAAQVAQLLSSQPDQATIDLLFPWPTDAHGRSELTLFARMQSRDNQWVEQSADVTNY